MYENENSDLSKKENYKLRDEMTQDDVIDFYLDTFIELSENLREEFYLKGNILLNKIYPEMARTTNDLDFSIINKELYLQVLVPRLEKFGDKLIENSIEVDSFIIKEISDTKSGGIMIKDYNDKTVYSIDVSLTKKTMYGFSEYKFSDIKLKASSIEKIIADKSITTLSKKRYRRIKDFYDLYIIMLNHSNYDLIKVKKLIIDSIGEEEFYDLINNYPFTYEEMIKLEHAWRKFIIKTRDPSYNKPEFSEIIYYSSKIYDNLK